MLKTYFIIGLSITSLAITAAEVKMPDLLTTGDAQAGAALVATCSACHGAQGSKY
jgi:cytochrome c553